MLCGKPPVGKETKLLHRLIVKYLRDLRSFSSLGNSFRFGHSYMFKTSRLQGKSPGSPSTNDTSSSHNAISKYFRLVRQVALVTLLRIAS
uniref:Uncharacterized protein n=1 Tax=Manihot esculenta TaxID=3983 RepID=A0A199U9E7_MANES